MEVTVYVSAKAMEIDRLPASSQSTHNLVARMVFMACVLIDVTISARTPTRGGHSAFATSA